MRVPSSAPAFSCVLLGSLVCSLLTACDPPPGCAYGETCGETESRVCGSFCRPAATPEMIEDSTRGRASVACAVDLCDHASYAGVNVFDCPSEYRCLGEPGEKLGQCIALPGLGERCGERIRDDGSSETLGCSERFACVSDAHSYSEWVRDRLALPILEDDPAFVADARCLPLAGEGEVCDSDHVDAGERPCASGYTCMDAAPFEMASEPGQRRCFRPCEVDGEVDEGLCRCSDEVKCEVHPDDGTYYCRPCAGVNEQACLGGKFPLGCCDAERGAECLPTGEGTSLLDYRCCIPEGPGECSAGLGPNAGCCAGTRCTADGCEACAGAGESPEDGRECCSDTRAFETDEGKVCRPCSDALGNDYCGESHFRIEGSDGAVDVVHIADRDRSFATRTSMTGGTLVHTREDARQAIYSLDAHHRAYLFADPMYEPDTREVGALRAGSDYTLLPFTDGRERRIELDDKSWQSVRVMDIGECSAFFDWDRLNHILVTQVLSSTSLGDDIFGLRSLSFQQGTIEPMFAQRPELDTHRLGSQESLDYFRVSMSLRANIKSCARDAEATYSLDARLVIDHPRLPTERTDELDALLDPESPRAIGCTFQDERFVCRVVPGAEADGTPMPAVLREYSAHPDPWYRLPHQTLPSVGCEIVGETYECTLPSNRYGTSLETVVFARPHSTDWTRKTLQVRVLDDDLDVNRRCYLSALFGGAIRRRIRREIEDARVEDLIDENLGGVVSLFGATPRRVLMHPTGLELVLAESEADPNYAMVVERLAELPLLGELMSCNARRFVSELEDEPTRVASQRFTTVGPEPTERLPGLNTRIICDHDAQACTGICAEAGVPCSTDGIAFALLVGDRTERPGGSQRCFSQQCCRHAEVCDGVCNRNFNTDNSHCGACGHACGEGENCRDGECRTCGDTEDGRPLTGCYWEPTDQYLCYDLFTSPVSCGECYNGCEAGERCEEATCVAE